MGFWSNIFGGTPVKRPSRIARRRLNQIIAASKSGGGSGGSWKGVNSKYDEDAFNKDYLTSLGDVQSRAQDLDVNNPDIGGFHRTRTAQIIGAGVAFKHTPRADEIKMTVKQATAISAKVDRARELHSLLGGFDSTGKGRSEAKQQERSILTMLIYGACLVHRVGKAESRALLSSFSIELIPGSRISTPIQRQGDPKISYGIEYSDNYRSRVVGYHIRRVSKTIGNSFVPDFTWDFIPAADAVLLDITEAAGLDRALPLSVRVIRQARNRGEFIESSVECARAQTKYHMTMECAPGADPWSAASDDADYTNSSGTPFTDVAPGVSALYTAAGEKATWRNAVLPGPDFGGFMAATDERMARGLGSSLSRFTRHVNSSWAGGRLEDQQDDPIIAQYRRTFLDAWHRVNEWFIEALWLENAVDLPGYSSRTMAYWTQHRATFPGKVHINPADTMNAREKAMMLRSTTPQEAAEEDGGNWDAKLDQWADAILATRQKEKDKGLEEGALSILFSGKAITTEAGEVIAPPNPIPAPEPGDEPESAPAKKPSTNGKKNGHRFNGDKSIEIAALEPKAAQPKNIIIQAAKSKPSKLVVLRDSDGRFSGIETVEESANGQG